VITVNFVKGVFDGSIVEVGVATWIAATDIEDIYVYGYERSESRSI
jgi:hypothetical protein